MGSENLVVAHGPHVCWLLEPRGDPDQRRFEEKTFRPRNPLPTSRETNPGPIQARRRPNLPHAAGSATRAFRSPKTAPIGDLYQRVRISIQLGQPWGKLLGIVGFPLRDFTGSVFGGTLKATDRPIDEFDSR